MFIVLGKYVLALVGEQEDRWDKVGTEPVDNYTFPCGNLTDNHLFGSIFFINDEITSAVNRLVC
jgi:hypothetical protein